MSKIVLLYNDKDIAVVRQVRRELKERWPDVEFWIADEDLTDPSALAVAIAQRFAFSTAVAAAQPAAEKIVFLHHPADRMDVRRLQASLRRKIDDKKYVLHSQDNLSSFGDAADTYFLS